MSEKRDICIILVSPLNPFFSEDNLKWLYQTTQENHPGGQVLFMVPDAPVLYQNFLAMGYPMRVQPESDGVKNDDLAESRARKYSNQLINKLRRIVPEAPMITFTDHVLSPVDGQKHFLGPKRQCWIEARKFIGDLTRNNSDFIEQSLELSLPVIESYASHFNKTPSSDKSKYLACLYFWDELATFSVIPQLLEENFGIKPESINNLFCVCPKEWPIFHDFFNEKYCKLDGSEGLSVFVRPKLERPPVKSIHNSEKLAPATLIPQ